MSKSNKQFRRAIHCAVAAFLAVAGSTGALAGDKATLLANSPSGFTLHVNFANEAPVFRRNGAARIVDFPLSKNESRPGTPILPTRTVFIAIPPKSKISAELLNIQSRVYSNAEPALNSKIILNRDSSISYQPAPSVHFTGDRYPLNDVEVAGYTWLGNYYCAIVKVNTHVFHPSAKQIAEYQGADLRITYRTPAFPARQNSTPENQVEKDLSKSILNYDQARTFRTFKASSFPPDTSASWIDYTKQYVKLAIPTDGLYRITYTDLANYGVPSNVDPKTIRLYESGKELPIYVSGESGGTFGPADYVEFWETKHYGSQSYRTIVSQGVDYLNYMDRYSDTTVVWMSWGWPSGLRVSQLSGNGSTTDTVKSHIVHLHLEQDARLWYYDVENPRIQQPFWQENKVWTWLVFNPGANSSIPFTANSVVPGTTATATARLISNGSGSNRAGLGFNSTTASDSITFQNNATVNFQSKTLSAKLNEGNNSVSVQGFSTGAVVDQFLLDWLDVDYYQFTNAINDTLLITIPDSVTKQYRIITVGGLTTATPLVYKLSPSTSRITGYSVSGTTTKTIYFADTVSGGDRYYITSQANIRTPLFLLQKQFANLRRSDRSADYIIISNKALSASATMYNNFVKSQYGVRTQLVYVDDIFDEFYFGYGHAESIRDFLMRANTYWQAPAPSYLLLIGDANYDYKHVITEIPRPKPNLVPSYGYPVSDAWYVTWDSLQSGGVPQMYVGRIPAESDGDVEFYLQKHQQYLQKSFDDWNKTLLFFSGGDPTVPGQIDEIYNENNSVYTSLALPPPLGGRGHHFYKTTTPATNYGPVTPEEFQDAINTGAVVISYIGHSGTQTWDNGITAVTDLKNSYSNRFPMVSDFGCSTGKFAEPDIDCFGQLFVSEDHNGQAIAYLGNTSLGYLSTSLSFPTYFYSRVLQDSITDIGRAHLLAKIQQLQGSFANDASHVFDYCNVLFGDPILKLALPPKPNYVMTNSSISLLGSVPTEAEDSVSLQVVVSNFGLMPPGPVTVGVNDKFNGATSFNADFKISPTTFWDTTVVRLPVKNLVGQHVVTVVVDSANTIDEIYKSDNAANLSFAVYSTNVRTSDPSIFFNAAKDTITLMNPVYKIAGAPERIRLSLDTTDAFSSPLEFTKNFDTVTTKVPLPSLVAGKRYWWRAKIDQASLEWSTPAAFINSRRGAQWLAVNPDSQNSIINVNTAYSSQTGGWGLVSSQNMLKVSSAGSSDGSFASILFQGSETLPNTYFWGIVTAVIDTVTLQPHGFQYFVTLNGTGQEQNNAADSLTKYINSLAAGTVLAMAICADGAQSVLGFSAPTSVRNAIKQLGSSYVDSVQYRDSWCLIGKKGASTGSVPETYKKQFGGPATASLSSSAPIDSGTILFPAIGPASVWDSLTFTSLLPAGSKINALPLGINSAGGIDTLAPLTLLNSRAVLNGINAVKYPQLKLLMKLGANVNRETPTLSNIAMYYKKPPELALNYQVAGLYSANRVQGTDSVYISTVAADTVVQGKYIGARWRVYNTGDVSARNVQVKSTVLWDNNNREELGTITIDSIPPGAFKTVQLPYNSSAGTGGRHFQMTIDPNDSIPEVFKDNNIYSIPFVVAGDTVLPPLPNLDVDPNGIIVPANAPDNIDSISVQIVVRSTGSARYDSVDVLVQQVYQSSAIKTWMLRIAFPLISDTVMVYPSIKGRAGEHIINVTIDPQNKIIESSKDDNAASKSFFVATTSFTALQPSSFSVSNVSSMILLNPSSDVWDGMKKILLDVDTISSFPAPKHFTSTMGQFSTSFDISSLRKITRYWWRAKVQNGTTDYTFGTFFLGDTAVSQIGQVDSTAWSNDSFVHTAYSAAQGAHVQDSPSHFRVVSAGFADGNFGDIEVNGADIIPAAPDTCHYVAVLDSSYKVLSVRKFGLYSNAAQADSLTSFINAVPIGNYVIAVIIGDGSTNFSATARNAYKSIGSTYAGQIGYRDSWAIIGRKGAAAGSVPESYKPTTTGKATLDTTYYHKETLGLVVTQQFGPLASWSALTVRSIIPQGSAISVAVAGVARNGSIDTVAQAVNVTSLNLQNVSAKQYQSGKLIFTLRQNTAAVSPSIQQWSLTSQPPPELALSAATVSAQKTTMNEGELSNLSMKLFNVSGVEADSVKAAILTDDAGFLRTLTQVVFPVIHAQDSAIVQAQYDSRGKKGSHLFYFKIDPDSTVPEIDKSNNFYTIAYTVAADTVRPTVDVTFDGVHVFDGEYVSAVPVIVFQMKDNVGAPLTSADTSSFFIWWNGQKVSFSSSEQIQFIPSKSEVIWKPNLIEGENTFKYYVEDVSGNSSDTTTLVAEVQSKLELTNLFNIPNPFSKGTTFTFTLSGKGNPQSAHIKIYTVAGRLIQDLDISPRVHIGANGYIDSSDNLYWDGRDRDGNEIANGVYFYRVIINGGGQQTAATQKLVKMR